MAIRKKKQGQYSCFKEWKRWSRELVCASKISFPRYASFVRQTVHFSAVESINVWTSIFFFIYHTRVILARGFYTFYTLMKSKIFF